MRRESQTLAAEAISVGYGDRPILDGLSVVIPPASLTVIVGANASGKSTLLRSLGRLLWPQAGTVILDGKNIAGYPTAEVARRLGLLPQLSIAPETITVAELVARGRYPHQSLWRHWSEADEAAVRTAMARTNVTTLSARPLDELSGGQRQRVWLAMVLAQETPVLLLDEPTTFLDIAHQIELMDLLSDLHAEGRTIVTVLHDLNQACRYATHLIAMKAGKIVAEGRVDDIVTTQLIEEVYQLACVVIDDPLTGRPMIVPQPRGLR